MTSNDTNRDGNTRSSDYLNKADQLYRESRYRESIKLYESYIRSNPRSAGAFYKMGMALHAIRKIENAIKSYDRAIEIDPNHADAYGDRGVALKDLKRIDEALKSYNRAIEIDPAYAEAYYNRAIALAELERFDEAISSYDSAITINPVFLMAYLNKGALLRELKRPDEAIGAYEKAIHINPRVAVLHNNKGVALNELKRFDEALESFDRAIQIRPDYAEAYYNRGNAMGKLKRFEEAIKSYDRAIQITPDYAEAYSNRGTTLVDLKRFEEALRSFDRAINLKPDYADAYSNRGIALVALKRGEEALQSHDLAIALKPDYAESHSNRGIALVELKRFEEALRSFDRAIQLKPDCAEAYSGRGVALDTLNRFEEALKSYDHAIQLKPDLKFVMGAVLGTKMKICDWSNYSNTVAVICDRISHDEIVAQPFTVLALSSSLELQMKASELFINFNYPGSRALEEISKPPTHKRTRIGYFSADFHNHAIMFLMAELFEKHDRSKFELIAFSFGPDTGDDRRQRLKVTFDKFIDVRNMPDRDVALLARSLEIDIGVDLNGFTKDSRTNIFAMRAAPIQVNYLGYPGTMGADYIDYLIADPTLIPISHQQHYAEKIAYLPNSYQPNDRKRQISDKVFTRAEVGLPQEGFVFCCFNNNYKITPDMFDSWMRILRHVEGSVLWLFEDNEIAARNLKKEASVKGTDPDRLVFAPRMALPDHLARHRLAGLFLDTLPYNAHTTASDALWAGLPVLTQIGETFAGRVAASLLNAVHLPELITTTRDAYEALAVELATNSAKLAAIKRKLSDNRLTAPLFDSELFAKHIEAAYTAMVERYRADLPPDHIYVPQ